MGLVRQMAAIPTSPLADPLPSSMATKQAGSGCVEVQPMRVEWGVVWRESGVLFLQVTRLALGVGLSGVRGMEGKVRDFNLWLKEDNLLAVSGSRKVEL